jgi:hypothetical protein
MHGLVRLGFAALAVPVLGLAAYGAARGVSDHPGPQVIIPPSPQPPSGGSDPVHHGVDAPASGDVHTGGDHSTRKVNDGSGRGDGVQPPTSLSTTQTTLKHGDANSGHNVGDDHGGAVTSTSGPTIPSNSSVPSGSGSSPGELSGGRGSGGG